MSKGIELVQGGKFGFKVAKVIDDESGLERFSVSMRVPFGGGDQFIAAGLTWAEAGGAMTKFRDEFEAAHEALVQISTLQPSGLHEEE